MSSEDTQKRLSNIDFYMEMATNQKIFFYEVSFITW